MIQDGIMVMLIGMSIVFVFLVLLNIAINILTSLTKEHAQKEQDAIAAEERALREKKALKSKRGSDTSLIAAIAAAVKLRA
ncbi:MAG: OadG family protein [Fibrobacterales bacterium]